MKNLKLLNLEDTERWDEWVAYLSSLKSINEYNMEGIFGEFEDCVKRCQEEYTYENERILNPLKENDTLKELLNKGYIVIGVEENRNIILGSKRNLTFQEIADKLKEEIRPYRTVYLNASRMTENRVKKIFEKVKEDYFS